MAKWAGILGSALKGAADVAVPAALQKTSDERRYRLQQLRDQALFAQQRSMAAEELAFRGAEGEANRGLQRDLGERGLAQDARRVGLIEAQMGQQADQFGQEYGLREQQHADDVRLAEEKLDIMRKGGSQSQDGDMQMISFLQSQLGKTPEEAFEMWKSTKNNPNDFIERAVIEEMKAQGEWADEPFDEQASIQKWTRAYELINGQEKAPQPGQGQGMFKFLGFED